MNHDSNPAEARPNKGQGMSGKYRIDDPSDTDRSDSRASAPDRPVRLSSRLRRRLNDSLDALDGRTGMLSSIRERPLAAAGIAFATGFLLAGSSDPPRYASVARAQDRIRSALLAGISAALSQQVRSFVNDHGGLGSILSDLRSHRGSSHDSYDDDDAYDDSDAYDGDPRDDSPGSAPNADDPQAEDTTR